MMMMMMMICLISPNGVLHDSDPIRHFATQNQTRKKRKKAVVFIFFLLCEYIRHFAIFESGLKARVYKAL